MIEKREQARRAAEEARARAMAAEEARARAAAAEARERAAAQEQAMDVMTGLRGLGFRADEARRAIESSAALQGATLEERMRAALKYLRPRTARIGIVAGPSA